MDAVAGIDRYPRKVTRSMGKNKIQKRSKVKPFVKYVNYNHVMPTRYVVDIDLKKVLGDDAMAPDARVEGRKKVKQVFEDRYDFGSDPLNWSFSDFGKSSIAESALVERRHKLCLLESHLVTHFSRG